jgi:hydrogenase expression/formation protein HypD
MQTKTFKHSLARIRKLAGNIARPVRLMEVCGTHTVAVCRAGLRSLLPANIQLLSGPGCPVCVTPSSYIDQAILLSRRPDVIITSFGDLLRVPGSRGTLETEKAGGADVRIVYSIVDALDIAEKHETKTAVFLAVGFETTAPGIAWAVKKAVAKKLRNFFLLTALKTMPNAMAALLNTKDVKIDGFICPGHVSTIIGTRPYEFISKKHHLPCVIAGFEVMDIVLAIEFLLEEIAAGSASVRNEYHRSVSAGGNPPAQQMIKNIFAVVSGKWRGLGIIPESGLKLKKKYCSCDAERLLDNMIVPQDDEKTACQCGDVLRGKILPTDCPLYGRKCTPSSPLGACMVSSEGACSAYYKYQNPIRYIPPLGRNS